jgi:hypothetical protein
MRESAYLSFTWFQAVTALTNTLGGNCTGRGPLSGAHIRSITKECFTEHKFSLSNTRSSLVHILTTKSVIPSHIISTLNFHVRKSETGFIKLEDETDSSSLNVGEQLTLLAV